MDTTKPFWKDRSFCKLFIECKQCENVGANNKTRKKRLIADKDKDQDKPRTTQVEEHAEGKSRLVTSVEDNNNDWRKNYRSF